MQFIDLAPQHERISDSVRTRMQRVFDHGQYILGPEVAELEQRLAERAGTNHCIGAANGTDAIQLALMALGIGAGDEVITPSFSYIAAAEVIALLGATPRFVDIDPITFNVLPAAVEAAISPQTKAIIPVDLFGQCADYTALRDIADAAGIPIIEDAAQSFGATQGTSAAGSFGAIATTSFFPSKPLGCYGDGGACFTDDDNLAEALRSIRAHGQRTRYYHYRVGVNARLDTLQAAILLAKLEVFDDEVAQRQEVANRYVELAQQRGLHEAGVVLPTVHDANTSVWAQYTIRVGRRDKIREHMADAGVPTTVHYPLALHEQEVFADGIERSDLEESTRAAREVLSLPMHPYLSKGEQIRVVDALAKATELTAGEFA